MAEPGGEVILLASGSPRRRDLLQRLGLDFEVVPAQGDGPARSEDPEVRVQEHARHKALEVAASHPGRWVLAADTLVHAGGRFLPKPVDAEEALRMLKRLQACGTHQVWTGACLVRPDGQVFARADVAEVGFRSIPEEALNAYLAGEEWCDKAGAYAIQGWAGEYCSLEAGNLDTVVGLAEEAVLGLFEAAGLPPEAFRR